MEIKEMQMSDIEQRSLEIEELMKAEDADIEALSKEVEELEARKAEIETEVEKRKKEAEEALKTAKEVEKVEERKMDNKEIRNSKEYIDAFGEYIRTGDDKVVRSLLTENASGTVAVPDFVYNIVKTAWDEEGIMSLVRKSYLKGNLKVGFEIDADEAAIHTEGGEAVSEENLTLGIVELKPVSIKKWISISDEVYDLRGEAFLSYIYREIAHRIAKKAADTLIAKIEACGTVSTTTQVGVPVVTEATLGLGTIAKALAELSDEATNPVIMMNKKSYAAFKAVQYAGNYAVDPFEGLQVRFNNKITAYDAATTGVTYALVGDLGEGALANFPNGEEITFKFDELSRKKEDLIEVLGREFIAIEPIAPNHFVKIQK